MREAVPLLKHHAELLAQLVDVGRFVMDVGSVDNNRSFLDRFQAIDAVEQRRFAGA
jgi:hypothetical protein